MEIKFTTKEYTINSSWDLFCKLTYKIVKRSDKNVWIENANGSLTRTKIYTKNNIEFIKPCKNGTYHQPVYANSEFKQPDYDPIAASCGG